MGNLINQKDFGLGYKFNNFQQIAKVSLGATHSLAINVILGLPTTIGFGSSDDYQLCTSGFSATPLNLFVAVPVIVDISAGSKHSLFLKFNNDLLACGDNSYGQLGAGYAPGVKIQTATIIFSSVTKISAGDSHTIVIKSNNVYTFGSNLVIFFN
jgi:alpha-tubulin suppressor-like RCC1 family protein